MIRSTIRIAGPGSGPMASRKRHCGGQTMVRSKTLRIWRYAVELGGVDCEAVYIAVMVLDALRRGLLRLIGAGVFVAAFIGVAYVTCSDNWRWRWGP
jgi:hypothetical protein